MSPHFCPTETSPNSAKIVRMVQGRRRRTIASKAGDGLWGLAGLLPWCLAARLDPQCGGLAQMETLVQLLAVLGGQ